MGKWVFFGVVVHFFVKMCIFLFTYSVAQGGHIAESARVLARRSAAPPRYRMALARQNRAMCSPRARKPRVQRPRDHDNQSTTPHQQSDCRQFTTSSLYSNSNAHTAATIRRVDCTWHSHVNNVWKVFRNPTLSHCRKTAPRLTLTTLCLLVRLYMLAYLFTEKIACSRGRDVVSAAVKIDRVCVYSH